MTHGLSVITTFRHFKQLTSIYQKAGKNDEYSTIADVDAIVLAAGEDEPVRKGTAFQVRLSFSYLYPIDLHSIDMASWIRVSLHIHHVPEGQAIYTLLCDKGCCTHIS